MTAGIASYSAAWAERFVREAYGLTVGAQPLAGEFDLNFLLETTDGERWVLKVSPAGAEVVALECQIAALKHLAETPLAPLTQRVLPTLTGLDLLPLTEDRGEPRYARTLSYLEGAPLARHSDRPPDFLEEVGRTLARLDLALADFDHPGARRDLFWDISRTAELGRFCRHIPDARRREMVENHLDHFAEEVRPRLEELAHSVIYNDANDYNLLVKTAADGTPELTGIIDYGDMLYTVTVAELAIACAYMMLDRDDPFASAAPVITGYHAVRPVTGEEFSVLLDLIIARLCGSVLMSARGQHEEPDNEYLQISAEPVWSLLERLKMIDRAEADTMIAAIRQRGR